jgi:hypothetical protein
MPSASGSAAASTSAEPGVWELSVLSPGEGDPMERRGRHQEDNGERGREQVIESGLDLPVLDRGDHALRLHGTHLHATTRSSMNEATRAFQNRRLNPG